MAACIGREFDYALLAAVVDIDVLAGFILFRRVLLVLVLLLFLATAAHDKRAEHLRELDKARIAAERQRIAEINGLIAVVGKLTGVVESVLASAPV